jgi:hypothetical protein
VGYAVPYARSSAFTFGVDCKFARARLVQTGDDAGDYTDYGWMVAPSAVLSVLL